MFTWSFGPLCSKACYQRLRKAGLEVAKKRWRAPVEGSSLGFVGSQGSLRCWALGLQRLDFGVSARSQATLPFKRAEFVELLVDDASHL